MFSYARTRGTLAALLTLGLAAATVAATPPAAQAADNAAPVLTSISLVSPKDVKPGDTLKVSYTATDDGDALASLRLVWTDSKSRKIYIDLGHSLPLTGEATAVLPDYLSNGDLSGFRVLLDDPQGGHSVFGPDQGVGVESLSVTMSGSTPDDAHPKLTSFGYDHQTLRGGDEFVVSTGIDEAHLDYAHSFVELHLPFSGVRLTATPDSNGTFRGVIPPDTAPGSGWVAQVVLRDLAGNATYYYSTGNILYIPGGNSTGVLVRDKQFRIGIDPALPELVSLRGVEDVTAPGQTATMTFRSIGDNPVVSISATYAHASGSATPPFTATASVTGADTATWSVPDVTPGYWYLQSLRLTDSSGDWTDWTSAGELSCSTSCPPRHSAWIYPMNLSIAAPPSVPTNVDPFAGNRSARLTWTPPALDNGAPVTGYSVTVSPSGKIYDLSATTRSLTVTGLTNDVRYSFAVRAKNLAGSGAATTVATTPRAMSRFTGAYDVNSDYRNDVVAINKYGSMYLYKGTGTGAIRTPGTKLTTDTSGVRILLDSRKVVRESGSELYAVLYNGDVVRYSVGTDGRAYRSDFTAQSFAGYRLVVSPGDFDGDGYVDLMGVTDAGDLILRTKSADGTLLRRSVRISGGWSAFNKVVGVGDVTGDGRNDLLARKKDGTLMLYAGNGKGGFAYAKKLFTGWNTYATFAAAGDFNKDGSADVLAVSPGGYLYLYKGNGKGGFAAKVRIATGMSSFV